MIQRFRSIEKCPRYIASERNESHPCALQPGSVLTRPAGIHFRGQRLVTALMSFVPPIQWVAGEQKRPRTR